MFREGGERREGEYTVRCWNDLASKRAKANQIHHVLFSGETCFTFSSSARLSQSLLHHSPFTRLSNANPSSVQISLLALRPTPYYNPKPTLLAKVRKSINQPEADLIFNKMNNTAREIPTEQTVPSPTPHPPKKKASHPLTPLTPHSLPPYPYLHPHAHLPLRLPHPALVANPLARPSLPPPPPSPHPTQ